MTAAGVSLPEKVKALPDRPGVYIFKSSRGEILYIGKALSLRGRVQSYFGEGSPPSDRIAAMLEQVADLEFLVTDSELEALILESNLIKDRQPRYNIILKDDKHYPFLKLDLKDPWPWVQVARRIKSDGALYFGPYVPAGAMWHLLALINKTFPLRKCRSPEGRTLCLEYHLGRCLGPCEGLVTKEEYADLVGRVRLLLEGKDQELVKALERQMAEAADRLEFERAARVRDQLYSVRRALEGQKVISAHGEEQDVFGLAREGGEVNVQLLLIRGGALVGRETFDFTQVEEGGTGALLASLLKQFYLGQRTIPREVLLSHPVEDADLIAQWLSGRARRRVELLVPQRGRKAQLVQMAVQNAQAVLGQSVRSAPGRERAMQELQEILDLPSLPLRIEAYDISTISGSLSVGSLVCFQDGQPRRAAYKRFRIKTVEGADDYASLAEVLKRRLARAADLPLPDLILIDGGRGQLNVGLQVAREVGVQDVAMVSLAKEEELIFHPDRPHPIALPETSRARHLLQQIRDEAHRFALAYHRTLRGKAGMRSVLDEIPGIGMKRKRILLQHFGSLKRLREASLEEIRGVAGIPTSMAESIHEFLQALA